MADETDKLLADRGRTHGRYEDHARVTQALLGVLSAGPSWDRLTDPMRESLHMFCHKMGRIVCGDPAVRDHWADIAGYARLVEEMLPHPLVYVGVDLAQPGSDRTEVWVGKSWGDVDTDTIRPQTFAEAVERLVPRPDPVPAEDSNRHAPRAAGSPWQVSDEEFPAPEAVGLVSLYYRHGPLWRLNEMIHESTLAAERAKESGWYLRAGTFWHLLDRRKVTTDLAPLQSSLNNFEHQNLHPAHRALYEQRSEGDGGWKIKEEYREAWCA